MEKHLLIEYSDLRIQFNEADEHFPLGFSAPAGNYQGKFQREYADLLVDLDDEWFILEVETRKKKSWSMARIENVKSVKEIKE